MLLAIGLSVVELRPRVVVLAPSFTVPWTYLSAAVVVEVFNMEMGDAELAVLVLDDMLEIKSGLVVTLVVNVEAVELTSTTTSK